MVPVVTRKVAVDEEICGYKVPKGAYIACFISAVHESEWEEPQEWRPERFLPGGEYESFDDSIRPHKVSSILHPSPVLFTPTHTWQGEEGRGGGLVDPSSETILVICCECIS